MPGVPSMKIKHPVYWKSTILRRLAIVVVMPVAFIVLSVAVIMEALPPELSDLAQDFKKAWRAPR